MPANSSARSDNLRHREIRRIRAHLELTGFPRLKMMLIVGLTGACGWLGAFLLLRAGVTSMPWRYPLSVGIAYLAFLFFLWLWLRTKAEDYTDCPSGDFSGPSNCHRPASDAPATGGGNSANDGGVTDVAEAVGGADEFAIPLFILILIGAMVLATGWIVYSAPVLFAELLVDGVLSASLYRRLKGLETRHWLETAIRRTAWPFGITTAVFWLVGIGLHALAPEATSIGYFLH